MFWRHVAHSRSPLSHWRSDHHRKIQNQTMTISWLLLSRSAWKVARNARLIELYRSTALKLSINDISRFDSFKNSFRIGFKSSFLQAGKAELPFLQFQFWDQRWIALDSANPITVKLTAINYYRSVAPWRLLAEILKAQKIIMIQPLRSQLKSASN